jgi:cytochrome bd-type quinol oxidase subunit 2
LPHRHRAPHRHQHRRAGLGRQPGLVHLGGGAIFAAWPPLYAVSFSGFYLAMFVVLARSSCGPVAFKYRSKRDDVRWRTSWDWALFASGAIPALLFGVAVGNVIQGVPFHFTDDLLSPSTRGPGTPSSSACSIRSRCWPASCRCRCW